MLRGMRRHSPALPIACAALLLAALGGSAVYAATKIDGHQIRTSSMPGNRIVPGSLPGNRLRTGSIPASRLAPGSVTGAQVNAATLGQVPSALHAVTAESARTATRATVAESAAEAKRVNGYSAGCEAGTRAFAGACWQTAHSATALDAPAAAASCATQGGELPSALALAAFAQQPGIVLAVGDEWSGDLTNASGLNAYSVFVVSPEADIEYLISTATRKFRCVLPLVG
jgi:hypothetical protein